MNEDMTSPLGGGGQRAGVIMLLRPDIGALALAAVLGVYALLAGVALLWAAWQVRNARIDVLSAETGLL